MFFLLRASTTQSRFSISALEMHQTQRKSLPNGRRQNPRGRREAPPPRGAAEGAALLSSIWAGFPMISACFRSHSGSILARQKIASLRAQGPQGPKKVASLRDPCPESPQMVGYTFYFMPRTSQNGRRSRPEPIASFGPPLGTIASFGPTR